MVKSSIAMAWSMALLLVSVVQDGWAATTFTVTNNCGFTVWPGALSNAGDAALSTTGFALQPGESKGVDAPAGWSGRFWGRTLCAADADGRFGCGSGDCGSGEVECSGAGAAPPATLAEFTLGGGSKAEDYYDVSLVDGYNLPVAVAPRGGGEGCGATGCAADVNGVCPAELKVLLVAGGGEEGRRPEGGAVCRSACEAFGTPEYCCSGAYGSPETCRPSSYSEVFKRACPRAYSYAYDDATSIFTCAGAAEYVITFCPSAAAAAATSQKSSGQNPDAGRQPSMVFLGNEFSKANPSNSDSHVTVRLALLIPLWVYFSLINRNIRRR
ncbi:thaumatin-like protein 1b [Zingiber officinale]|uniref:thaumatin-like protein 1b n=1 Tax=Zingiber officinale TaxID=94328 RepID=UPI001C4B5EF9|nr:thaumatin-like protein 1b [Zingiber officinale]